jgi:translation initiation factor IF-1
MSSWMRLSRRTMVVGGVIAMAGCAGMGPMAEVLTAGTGSRDVSGEVRHVDERSRTIQISNWYGGSSIRYDGRTQVTYSGRSYPIRSLDRGDRVSIQVERGNRGDLYARRIRVESTRRASGQRDDRRAAARLSYVEGRVHRIDQRQGWMEVRPNRGSTVRLTLPQRARRDQVRSFQRLRRGDHVRVQAAPVSRNRMEIVRII